MKSEELVVEVSRQHMALYGRDSLAATARILDAAGMDLTKPITSVYSHYTGCTVYTGVKVKPTPEPPRIPFRRRMA